MTLLDCLAKMAHTSTPHFSTWLPHTMEPIEICPESDTMLLASYTVIIAMIVAAILFVAVVFVLALTRAVAIHK